MNSVKLLCTLLSFGLSASFSLASGAGNPRDDLIVAVPNPIVNTDPEKVTIAQERFILPLVYEGLFKVNEDGAISPSLAEAWSFDRERQELTISIRPKHYFSDGSEVTVKDVIHSFEVLCSKQSRIRDLLEDLVGCLGQSASGVAIRESVNQASVVFQIKFEPTSFLYRLASHPISIFKRGKDGSAIGSGPYYISSKTKDSVTLAANTFTAGTPTGANHRKISFKYYEEKSIGIALSSHQIDIAAMYLSSTGKTVQAPGYTTQFHSPSVTQTLVVNPAYEAFRDKSRRQELQRQVNEVQKLEECAPGAAAATGFIPPGIGGSLIKRPAPSPQTPGDQKYALVPKASRYEITIYEHKDRASPCDEKRIIAAMEAVGISARFKYENSYAEMGPRRGDPKTPAYIELFVFPSRDASTVLRRFLPGSREAYFFYSKNLYVDLLHQAMKKSNLSDRFEDYRSINNGIYDELIVIPMYYIGHVNFIKKCMELAKDLNGIFISPNSFSYLEKISRGKSCL